MVFVSERKGDQLTTEIDYDVLLAGAGPVGLMLATELRLCWHPATTTPARPSR